MQGNARVFHFPPVGVWIPAGTSEGATDIRAFDRDGGAILILKEKRGGKWRCMIFQPHRELVLVQLRQGQHWHVSLGG